MGHAIAQVFASAGYWVHLYDADVALPEKIQQVIEQRDTVLLRIINEIIGGVKGG